MKQKVKRIMIAFAAVVVLWVAVFLGARYGWGLAGFSTCQTVQIESVNEVTDCVGIEGNWPEVFPESFVGYHAEIVDGVLYVGFKYNKLLGVWIYDKGDFQIEVPVEQPINAVCMKAGDDEREQRSIQSPCCSCSQNTDINQLEMQFNQSMRYMMKVTKFIFVLMFANQDMVS